MPSNNASCEPSGLADLDESAGEGGKEVSIHSSPSTSLSFLPKCVGSGVVILGNVEDEVALCT